MLQGYLKSFAEQFGFPLSMKETTLFEHYVNYCIISKYHPEIFGKDKDRIEEVNIGGTNDTGIDGLAIFVNERLISTEDEVNTWLREFGKIDVNFVFIQSKFTSTFESGDIHKFIHGIKDFFSKEKDVSNLKRNEKIEELIELKKVIYDKSLYFGRKPEIHYYYVTSGNWDEDQNIIAVFDQGRRDLLSTGLFEEVKFFPVDSSRIQNIYKELQNQITKTILIPHCTKIPYQIEGVREAYIGVLHAKEFVQLLSSDDGKLQRNLFFDNVRDYLGKNPINKEIEETVKEPAQQNKFALMNNGVTIVAKSLEEKNISITIRDFQIVNGCQTSHVIFNNKGIIKEDLFIPVKVIVTNDVDITNKIIRATNRQNEVKIEAFESINTFHKDLEDFYNSEFFKTRSINKIYYERRTKSYTNILSSTDRNRIVTLAAQVYSIIAMFYNEPHSSNSRYYGELLKVKKEKAHIFINNHSKFPYFISGYTLHIVDSLFNEKKIKKSLRPYKYHFLMVFRLLSSEKNFPKFESRKIEEYCERILLILEDEDRLERYIKKAEIIISSSVNEFRKVVKQSDKSDRQISRLKAFTDFLIEITGNMKNKI